jgi:hypothetical protein
VPHVTLNSIANNPDIREGMTRAEIDAAIVRHPETETLYDQPYEDNKRVRVAGPFTVESLSPHRTISVEEKQQRAEVGDAKVGLKMQVVGPDKFGQMILDNLRKAGVQNTKRGERLKFDSLEPYAGEWIHGEGRYTESDGRERRAAICIGPEFGTVGASLIKEAAKEAVRGIGFDVLIVCGFAFDASVAEEAKEYGLVAALQHHEPPLRSTHDRQNRRQSHQPLRRRGAQGVHGLSRSRPTERCELSARGYKRLWGLSKMQPSSGGDVGIDPDGLRGRGVMRSKSAAERRVGWD